MRSEMIGARSLDGETSAGRRGLAWLAMLAGLILAGCTSLMNPGAEGPTAAVIGGAVRSPVEDKASAEENARIVAAYGGIYHNDKLETTLVPIVSRIVASSDKPDQPYKITILNAPAVNAFALPGGYLYVTRGLLARANDSSEVAAVLAHEMAHITANHAMQRQEKARNAVLVSRVMTDVLDNQDAGQLALASSQRTLAAFSRQQELEADAIGIKTIGKAGYDPFAAARFLSAMGRFSAYRTAATAILDKRPDFLASHPSTPERIDFAIKAARQFGAPGIGEVDREGYLAGVDGVIFGDDPSQGFVRDRTFVHPSLGVSFTVPEGFVIDNTSDAVLATGTDGTALRFDAVGVAAGTPLSDYLASGWVNGLAEGSIKTFTVNGLPAASASANAKGWIFRIAVVQATEGSAYRFIYANQTDTPEFEKAAAATTQSFRKLPPSEAASLRPLRIHVATVGTGDSVEAFARRMRGVDRPLELFRVLNDLEPDARLVPGSKVKIVDDR